jgi:hypothetical protein
MSSNGRSADAPDPRPEHIATVTVIDARVLASASGTYKCGRPNSCRRSTASISLDDRRLKSSPLSSSKTLW